MKNFLKLLLAIVAIMFVYTSCQKLDPLPHFNNGTEVSLTSSATILTPALADSNNVVVSFSWTMATYATDSSNYKYVLEIDTSGGNFVKGVKKVILAANTTSLTGRELNNILINYASVIGQPYNLDVRLASSYANNNEVLFSNTIKLSVTPYNDPPVLTSTETTVTLALADALLHSFSLDWTRPFTGYTGAINYTLEIDSATKGFVNPPIVFDEGTQMSNDVNQGSANATAASLGIVGGTSGTVEFRIKAVTALGAVSYSNVVNVHMNTYAPPSIVRYYLPGDYQTATGNGTDWTPSNAPELIRDLRPGLVNDMFYIYIYLPAGAAFKVAQDQSWNVNYGGSGGVLVPGGGNLTVPTAGYYRISIKISDLSYNIMEGRMGFVGGATGADWTPGNVFPNYALAPAATNLFIGVTDFHPGGWKLIDNNTWNNGSNAVDETRGYGTPLASGSTMEVNGANFADITATGPTPNRAIWDGRDRDNIIYQFMDASIMKIVGDGITGVAAWTPAVSPLMTYSGNGVWTITIGLEANLDFKFLAGADWGALDYEDNSGQSQATGVANPRKIQWEGGPNFKTPATAGTYTITLNENTQLVTITP